MRRTETLTKATKAEYPYPVRVLLSSFPVAVVILPVLWLTGYPPEEWPFVSGVFALSLLGAGTVVGYGAWLVVSKVYNYAGGVAARQGIDLNQTSEQASNDRSRRVISAIISMALLAMSTWGLALYVLALVMAQLAMPPIGAYFTTIAVVLLAIGALGFGLIAGGLALFFRTIDRNPRRISRFSTQFRNWMNIVGHIGERRRIAGVPNLTGNSL